MSYTMIQQGNSARAQVFDIQTTLKGVKTQVVQQ